MRLSIFIRTKRSLRIATVILLSAGALVFGQTAPEHRIGVRVVNGSGRFYDRATGQEFVPRGNNYIRLTTHHSTFDPGLYDAARSRAAFRRMHADGYNIVRVFLNAGAMADPGGGLSAAYLRNLTDFLRQARANRIYVLIAAESVPAGKYSGILQRENAQFQGYNLHHLARSGLDANRLFFQDLVRGLLRLHAPLDAIFAYELRNELFFETNLRPFTLTSGKITTANGETYDMANPQDKQRMAEENLPYWMDQLRDSIRTLDPAALVTCGFFHPQKPNPSRIGDARLVTTYPAIWKSHADFIDLHMYPGVELTVKQYAENFQINGMREKPLLMGEFGAFTHIFPTVDAAARALVAAQIESCRYGFSGWLLWTWDTEEQLSRDRERPLLFTATGGQGQIEKALAPAVRPGACTPADSGRGHP